MLERSTLTDRFQTTIPAIVRKTLGLKPGQKITYEMHDQGVLIRPADTLMELAGSLRSDVKPRSKKLERNAARDNRLKRNQ